MNSRLVAGGIDRNRWNGYLRDILRCLRGGGWCQMVEMDFNAQSDNGTLTDGKPKARSDAYTIELTTSFLIGHALRQWSDKYRAATAQFKNPDAPRRLGHWMRHAGFTDVEERSMFEGLFTPNLLHLGRRIGHSAHLGIHPLSADFVVKYSRQHLLIDILTVIPLPMCGWSDSMAFGYYFSNIWF